MQNKIFGHFFLYDFSAQRKSLKILIGGGGGWGGFFFKTKRRLNNKAFCFKR